jgi:hypothetical protein
MEFVKMLHNPLKSRALFPIHGSGDRGQAEQIVATGGKFATPNS